MIPNRTEKANDCELVEFNPDPQILPGSPIDRNMFNLITFDHIACSDDGTKTLVVKTKQYMSKG
jgi:hypothetical protein